MFTTLKWFSKDLAIDLGTANTLVFIPRKGIVINEPSFIATDTRNGKVLAVGQEAKDMFGKAPEQISIVRPLKDGVIADFKMATAMLKYFVKKAMSQTHFLRPRIIIAVPFGITEVEKKAVRDAAMQAGASKVMIILEPMAAAIGAGLPVRQPLGNMVIDIGGGTTDVAIISLTGIVSGQSIRVAGDEMNEAIIRYLRQKYNLLIGLKTAEFLKTTIGSAAPLENEQTVEVRGRNLTHGVPSTQRVSSEEIRDALEEPLLAIMDTVRCTLEKTPPEVSADIMKHGIVLTGGGALLKNLDDKITREIGLSVALADDPLTTVAVGAGKAMLESEYLNQLAIN